MSDGINDDDDDDHKWKGARRAPPLLGDQCAHPPAVYALHVVQGGPRKLSYHTLSIIFAKY